MIISGKESMLVHHHLSKASAIIGIGGMLFNLHMIVILEMETWRFREVNTPKIWPMIEFWSPIFINQAVLR